jgi:hypothetical protein
LTGFKIETNTAHSALAKTGDLVVALLLMENLFMLLLPTLLSTGGLEIGMLMRTMVFTIFLSASGLQVVTLFNSLASKAAVMAVRLLNKEFVVVAGLMSTSPSPSTAPFNPNLPLFLDLAKPNSLGKVGHLLPSKLVVVLPLSNLLANSNFQFLATAVNLLTTPALLATRPSAVV